MIIFVIDTSLIQDIAGIFIFSKPQVNLLGCIALDNRSSGNIALGGTRLTKYSSFDEAIKDTVRLALSMSEKCKAAELPFTGGKTVILEPDFIENREVFFMEYAKILNSLNGSFITGCDVGLFEEDVNAIAKVSSFVTGFSQLKTDYLSYLTACSVVESIKVSFSKLYKTNSLKNSRVLVQGIGKVGAYVAKIMDKLDAQVMISDVNPAKLKQIQKDVSCKVVDIERLFDTECDVFCPCALGGILNVANSYELKCKLVCGSANNPIYDYNILHILDQRGIIFIPDWISNVGGVIYAALSYQQKPIAEIETYLKQIIDKRVKEFLDYYTSSDLFNAVNASKSKPGFQANITNPCF